VTESGSERAERQGSPEIDRLVHEPARLAILSVLAACERADFLFLERATGLSRGNLSVQLSRLEEAGVIEIEKTIERKRTLTTAALTRGGRGTLDAYWKTMDELRARSQPVDQAAGARPQAEEGRQTEARQKEKEKQKRRPLPPRQPAPSLG
jgi:DNA-binding transcriptional ArsR family regulator